MASPTIKMLWGLAKSPELSMTDEELHLLVSAHTGKDSIRALNKRELGTMVSVLQNMKDSSSKGTRNRQRRSGNVATANQRKKVYKLTEELGWSKKARVNGLCKKMFQVSSVEWLNYQQCSKLIEALKSMVEREKVKNVQGEKESRLLIVLKGGKVEFQATNIDMVELATMCGALEQLMGVEAIRRGKSLDDVKDSMLDIHFAAMRTLSEQIIREEEENSDS